MSAALVSVGVSSSISIFFFRNNPPVNITPTVAQEEKYPLPLF